tara:strand:+ start:2180 stop:3055 length:876 start_codon:yes stop_codon:yes gene_type:complete
MKLKKKIFKNKDFKKILFFLKKFTLKSFENPKKTDLYMRFFELKPLLKRIPEDYIKSKVKDHLRTVSKIESKPFVAESSDLCRLHWTVLSGKIINTLEFGSGFSTVFIADAKFILNYYFKDLKNMRYEKMFHVYSVEEDKNYLKTTQKRIPDYLKKHVSLSYDKIDVITYKERFASKYRNLPNISPDLIYLDAPSIYFTKKTFKGFSFLPINRVPMSADVLFIEYFLEPGTKIIVDGRTANANFLKDHFNRNWKYRHDFKGDCHYFELIDTPWGKYNIDKLNFKNTKIKFI